jgi:hypothetical protein
VEREDVEKHRFVPDDYFKGFTDDFWAKLPQLDADSRLAARHWMPRASAALRGTMAVARQWGLQAWAATRYTS